MKKIVIISLISLALLATIGIAVYRFMTSPPMTGTDWDGRIINQLDAEARFAYFASGLHLEGDSSVWPSSDYPALDSIVSVMKEFERHGFLYIIHLHSYHPERNDQEEQVNAQGMAEAFRQYFINAGAAPEQLTAKGTGGKAYFRVYDDEPLDWSKPHKQLEIDVELSPIKK